MKTLHISIIIVTIAISAISNSAYAQSSTVSLSMQKDTYYPNDVVVINGTTTSNQLVTVEIKNPFDKSVFEKSLLPSAKGAFSISYIVDSYPTKGTYVVIATQNSQTTASYFGVYSKPAIRLESTMDKINYQNTDQPHITILDLPESVIDVKILDNSQVQKFEDKIKTTPDGHAMYSLNVTSYPVGVYNALVTSSTGQAKLGFSVGLMPTGGRILVNTEKGTYSPGNDILILGTSNANSLIELSLVDPNGISVKSTQTFSNNTGHFTSSGLKIPQDAISGSWRINATSGVNHASLDIQVISSNYTIKNENTTHLYGSSGSITAIKAESPLKQFHSGIKPEYVKCSQNLHLIIKAEDGSFACATIETGKNLAIRGWATTFGTGISTNDYYTKCDTLYPQSDTGIAVLYMPMNSIGKICVQYHNLNNTPTGIGMRIFEANNLTQNASNVTAWTYDSTLEANANKTIVYFIKTGTRAGFYGASLNCGGIPLAVGYDANSTITANDFPWVGKVFHCMAITYESHMEGTAGIGVKYIPYP